LSFKQFGHKDFESATDQEHEKTINPDTIASKCRQVKKAIMKESLKLLPGDSKCEKQHVDVSNNNQYPENQVKTNMHLTDNLAYKSSFNFVFARVNSKARQEANDNNIFIIFYDIFLVG
jgi:hypothetical protein